MIGDRLPNVTTTSTATGFVSENIQYVDVGLKLEIQPTVFADNEVTIRISREVSTVVDKLQTKSGSWAYQIGTRNASTLLRLRDGENQVLAGLIRDDDLTTASRIPGLGDIPLLGRIFGTQRDEKNKTEIVLSITPRLVKDVRRPDATIAEFDSGSESMLRVRGEDLVFDSPDKLSPATADRATNAFNNGSGPNEAEARRTRLNVSGPTQAKVGETFVVQLAIEPGEPIASVPAILNYDRKVFDVIDVEEGDVLRQNNGTTAFSNRVDRNGGQVFATVARTTKDGVTEPGRVLAVRFKAMGKSSGSGIQVNTPTVMGPNGKLVDVAGPSTLSIAVSQ